MADYVIVGAGSAGCVLAGRLSEDPDVAVLLLEAGGPDTAAELHVPAMFPLVFKSSLDWDLFGEEEPGLGGRRLYLPRGRVIGGSSSINAMIYLRGHRADFDELGRAGLRGLVLRRGAARTSSAPRTTSAARASSTASAVRSSVSDSRSMCPLIEAQLEAAVAGGLRAHRGPERRPARGCLALPAHTAERHALQRRRRVPAPGRVEAEPRGALAASSSSGSSSRATAQSASSSSRNGVRETVRAEREVIVSGGTYQSPVLLMLSGIGPAEDLELFGIPVRQDLPVGHNLQDHCMVNVNYLTDQPGPVRDLHARELRAPRERGPRPADLELPRGGRLLHDAVGPAGAGRRVPLRRRAVLRPGPHAARPTTASRSGP